MSGSMIGKKEFLAEYSMVTGASAHDLLQVAVMYDESLPVARTALNSMPSIGFMSSSKRLAAFFSVCRHLENLVLKGHCDLTQAIFSLALLRKSSSDFRKCIDLFDSMAPRISLLERSSMSRVARTYLASLEGDLT